MNVRGAHLHRISKHRLQQFDDRCFRGVFLRGELVDVDALAPKLFDLVRDPGERKNLAKEHPERLRDLRRRIDAHLEASAKLSPDRPPQRVPLTDADVQHLAEGDYAEGDYAEVDESNQGARVSASGEIIVEQKQPPTLRSGPNLEIADLGPGGGYMMCASDHFYYTPLENIQAYADAARECVYG